MINHVQLLKLMKKRLSAALRVSRGCGLERHERARLFDCASAQRSFGSWISLVEQLPPAARNELVDSLCRDLPLLDHSRLRHCPAADVLLARLRSQPRGFTVITGGLGCERTFLIMAIGHTWIRHHPGLARVVGLNGDAPTWYVPVPTLAHLGEPGRPQSQALLVRALWPCYQDEAGSLVLLNRVWSLVPDLHQEIIRLSRENHVVVADSNVSIPPGSALPFLNHLVVSAAPDDATGLRVELKPASPPTQ